MGNAYVTYKNGIAFQTAAVGSDSGGGDAWWIGSNQWWATQYWNSEIYFIACYDRILTPLEAKSLYVDPYAMFEPEPIYLFGQGAAGGVSYSTEITETFSNAGSPPANWTERNGSYTCDGSILETDDATSNRCITHDTELSQLNHWVKVEFNTYVAAGYDGVVLRSPDATSVSYTHLTLPTN